MSRLLKTLTHRRATTRHQRRIWEAINNAPTTLRNELIHTHDHQHTALHR